MSSSNNNASAPNKPIFQIGLYKYVNRDESECLECPLVNGKRKVIKTLKYSYNGLISHLPAHPDYQKKYKDLVENGAPNIEQYFVTPVGEYGLRICLTKATLLKMC